MKKLVLFTAPMLALAACGQSAEDKEAEFRSGFMQSCVAAATTAGTPDATAKKVCECSADKVIAEMGAEVINLPAPVANRIVGECTKELGVEPATAG